MLFFSTKNPEKKKCITDGFHKNMKQLFLEQQISILDRFLKAFSFAITGMNSILKYIKIENLFFIDFIVIK